MLGGHVEKLVHHRGDLRRGIFDVLVCVARELALAEPAGGQRRSALLTSNTEH